MEKKGVFILMSMLLLACSFLTARLGAKYLDEKMVEVSEAVDTDRDVDQDETIGTDTEQIAQVVVVDVGHGGEDPGKVGVSGVKEKDVNLLIAGKLKDCLEAQGIKVVMTREDDNVPASKHEDMQNRCALIQATKPVLTVSIHQNSYTAESVRGPQVFYYTTSAEGEKLAGTLQNNINEKLNIARTRTIKANDTYYLLKRSEGTTVIVECGFLSCPEEEQLLNTDDYQEKMAEAICAGIMEYLSN